MAHGTVSAATRAATRCACIRRCSGWTRRTRRCGLRRISASGWMTIGRRRRSESPQPSILNGRWKPGGARNGRSCAAPFAEQTRFWQSTTRTRRAHGTARSL
nr:MAG TPA: hypothetical protein [Caudoviricetes sp.]